MVASTAEAHWAAVTALAIGLAGVAVLLVVFLRVVVNHGGALDRTVERFDRLPAWTRLGRPPHVVRRSRQFTAAAGAALLFAVFLLLGGLLMDQVTG